MEKALNLWYRTGGVCPKKCITGLAYLHKAILKRDRAELLGEIVGARHIEALSVPASGRKNRF